jgi:bis(5'-nucleosidyl)-tetraphosphatase
MKQEHAAGIIIYHYRNDEPHYLLLHYVSGHWDFPKGRLEQEETIYEAAQRELQEETGLYAQVHEHFLHTFEYILRRETELTLKTVNLFVGYTPHQEVVLSREHVNFTWLPFSQACGQLTYENAKEALRAAHHFIDSLNK